MILNHCIEHYFCQGNYWQVDGGLFLSVYQATRFVEELGGHRLRDGSPLPPQLRMRLEREYERLAFIESQLELLAEQRREALRRSDDERIAKVRKLVAFYVAEHNGTLPHSAFRGQTPDEMYFGTGEDVPGRLTEGKAEAWQRRLEANRRARCSACA